MKPSTLSKVLLTILALAFSILVASAQGTSNKGMPIRLSKQLDSLTIGIRPNVQQDLDEIQKSIQEINAPDYVKKQTAILNERLTRTVLTIVKNDARCDSLKLLPMPRGLKYLPGKIVLTFEK